MLEEIKPWYESRTIWASLVTMFVPLGVMADIQLSADAQMALVDMLLLIGTSASGVIALWGRVRATTRIGKRPAASE